MIPVHAPHSPSLRRATRLTDRLRGLLGRQDLDPSDILLIEPCASIHTIGMRLPIDVVFVGRDGRILRIDRAVPPWRMRICLSAGSVLEMAAGGAARMGWVVGERWSVEGMPR